MGRGEEQGARTTRPPGTSDPEGADPELDFDLENKLFPEKGEGVCHLFSGHFHLCAFSFCSDFVHASLFAVLPCVLLLLM